MLLADEFFLISHHEDTGKPRLYRGALGLGLAGAVLCELVAVGNIAVRSGRLVPVGQRNPPRDAVGHMVFEQVVAEPEQHDVRTWLTYVGQDAAELVGRRLLRTGIVEQVRSRRMLRQVVAYVPVDPAAAERLGARLFIQLNRREQMQPRDVALAALIVASGLAGEIMWADDHASQQHLRQASTLLSPSMREIIAQTDAAVGDGVLSNRP